MLGSSLPAEWAGAFVNVYVGATNIKAAIDYAESALADDKYQPINIDAAWEIDLDQPTNLESDNSEDFPSEDELLEVQRNGGVLYGAFHGYAPEPGQV